MMETKLARRMEVIQRYKENGGGIAAVLPIHYPRSLLRAFDLLPVEVWGPPRLKSQQGSAHLQSYICSIAQNALSFLESGGLDVADVLLIPHACDSLQGLGSILIDFVQPQQPVLPLYLPRRAADSDMDFLAEEFHALYQRLQGITGQAPSEADLGECIQREETADDLLLELHKRRGEFPLTDEQFYRSIRMREYLPAEEFIELAQNILASDNTKSREGIPILLSGYVPEPMSIFAAISELGGRVAADDLACCGRRLYPPGKSDDPFRRMAERILTAPPDPTRGSSLKARREHLLDLAKSSGARGVIFYEVKFCEPELFDLPLLYQALQEAGCPTLVVEIDINDELAESVKNRLAAFLEMLA